MSNSHVSPGPMPAEGSIRGLTPPGSPDLAGQRRLRLWPGVVIIALQWLLLTAANWLVPGTMLQFMTMFVGPMIGALALTAWWLFASRLRWRDRWLLPVTCAALGAVAYPFCDPTFNLMILMFYAVPALTTAWIVWLVVTPFLRWPVRRLGLVAVFLLVWGYCTVLRFDGVYGDMSATLPYRWTPTAEEKHKAEHAAAKMGPGIREDTPPGTPPLALQPGDWPGFRGAQRDGRLTGFRMATDWEKRAPRQLWRHRVGPGWSSFAVVGTRLYTQEQWDEKEIVVCYDTGSGAELWAHGDPARFTELVAGPGPRATPTFHEGKIYALGAAGRLNCLDAATGRPVWSSDIVADSGATVPTWGFAASPLVAQGVVTVFAGGPNGKAVLGYDSSSGELAWTATAGQLSYCSLQPARLGGVDQLLIATETGVTALEPGKGGILWRHDWPLSGGMARVTQPALVDDSSILIGTGFNMGTRRVGVHREGDKWAVKEEWTTRAIRPYYNDLVVHKGYLYGFDGSFFTCVSLENGKNKWRERGYGNGQVLLLADQDLLLILAETGEVALVEANPGGHKELGRFQALEGKSWNHPVIAHGMLFVRNGAEAACYQLVEDRGADR